jgi:hypothetical protein
MKVLKLVDKLDVYRKISKKYTTFKKIVGRKNALLVNYVES